MTGSTRPMLALVLLTVSATASCENWQTSGAAIDRLRPDAAAHARALSGDDMARARETGLTLLARLGAYAGW